MNVFIEEEQISWLDAEVQCQERGARLVSIKNESQMLLVNFILVDNYGSEDVYIGRFCSKSQK